MMKPVKALKSVKRMGRVSVACIAVIFMTAADSQAAIPAEERAALIALYNATDGYSWNGSTGWKGNNGEPDGFYETGSEGSWYGVTVTDDHVKQIRET